MNYELSTHNSILITHSQRRHAITYEFITCTTAVCALCPTPLPLSAARPRSDAPARRPSARVQPTVRAHAPPLTHWPCDRLPPRPGRSMIRGWLRPLASIPLSGPRAAEPHRPGDGAPRARQPLLVVADHRDSSVEVSRASSTSFMSARISSRAGPGAVSTVAPWAPTRR
jgi:hypothetical protein